jgi:hypothetical protein
MARHVLCCINLKKSDSLPILKCVNMSFIKVAYLQILNPFPIEHLNKVKNQQTLFSR